MRLSTDSKDPAYMQGLCGGVTVFLDGIERTGVFTADEEGRHIVIAKRDERGHMAVDREKGEVVRETLHGDVRIELADGTRKALQMLGVI
ncbi:hypothetical protein [Azohydromonas lata]|uniref:hypothetical protein n=1 Tax=Azohydromonas lata TaxID=45677 RepID=UPI000835E16F|nr:hypothetical protein [Azohydromonas lata]